MPIVDSLSPRPPFMPQAIPADLAPRLLRLHGHPFVWWISQFVSYLFRPQPRLVSDIEQTRQKLGFHHPIVGSVGPPVMFLLDCQSLSEIVWPTDTVIGTFQISSSAHISSQLYLTSLMYKDDAVQNWRSLCLMPLSVLSVYIHCVSKKYTSWCLMITLVNMDRFQNSFTYWFVGKFSIYTW